MTQPTAKVQPTANRETNLSQLMALIKPDERQYAAIFIRAIVREAEARGMDMVLSPLGEGRAA